VCPQNDPWRKMNRTEACRNKALKCECAALIATDSKVQAAYRNMARQWREIAEQAEVLDRRQAARGETMRQVFLAERETLPSVYSMVLVKHPGRTWTVTQSNSDVLAMIRPRNVAAA
jgi:hypothetical protein